jgi:hypothetical protein
VDLFTFLMIGAAVLGARDGYRSYRSKQQLDPYEVARPSLERLEAEAIRAADELRQLDRGGR